MSDTNGAPAPQENQAPQTPVETKSILNQEGEVVKTVEVKGEEKPVEQQEKKDETPAPLKAEDIKLPEGFQASEEVMGKLVEVMNDSKMSAQDRANALIQIHASELQKAREGVSTEWNKTVEVWHKEVANDRELGSGDSKKPLKAEVAASISKTIDQFGGTKLREALDLTGAGNNPEIIRAFAKIAKVVTEGNFINGEPSRAKPKGTGAAALYPDNPTE